MHSRRRTQSIGALVCASLLMLVLDNPASAETYRWTDKNGAVGFADSLEKVPPEYRKSAKRLTEKGTGDNFQTVPSTPAPYNAAPPEYSPALDPDYWRERILAAHAQLEQLKAQRQQAQQTYDNLLGLLTRGKPRDPHDVEKATSRISTLDQQIQDKEREISNLTDEARRAGIPSSAISP